LVRVSDNFYCENKETWLKNIRYCAVKISRNIDDKNPTHPLQLFFVKLLLSRQKKSVVKSQKNPRKFKIKPAS